MKKCANCFYGKDGLCVKDGWQGEPAAGGVCDKHTCIYQEHGYKDREDYLNSLADEYGIDIEIIKSLADANGENEDFDGLITMLKDEYEGW